MSSSSQKDKLVAAVELVNQCLTEGFLPQFLPGVGNRTAVAVAAERWVKEDGAGITHDGFKRMLLRAKSEGLEPDWTLYKRDRYQQPVAKAQVVQEPPPPRFFDDNDIVRVLVIPDRHNDPRAEHRLAVSTWIARYGSDHRIPNVVDLGDAVTMDSVSRHDKNDTLRGRMKPPIKADLDNHLQMLQAFERGRLSDWKPKMIRTRGNHEQRLFEFENQHPENEGTHTHRYMQDMLQFGWRERPYGEIVYIGGCGFTHAPFNGLGKPMGGKTATHRAGGLLCESLVHGHTHSYEVHNAAKLGPTDRVTVVQAGCALPEGEVEHYASHNPTGWSYGIVDMTVQHGAIIDIAFVSMRRIRNLYSDDGADTRA